MSEREGEGVSELTDLLQLLGFILRKIIHPLNAHSDRNFAKIDWGRWKEKNVAVVVMRVQQFGNCLLIASVLLSG